MAPCARVGVPKGALVRVGVPSPGPWVGAALGWVSLAALRASGPSTDSAVAHIGVRRADWLGIARCSTAPDRETVPWSASPSVDSREGAPRPANRCTPGARSCRIAAPIASWRRGHLARDRVVDGAQPWLPGKFAQCVVHVLGCTVVPYPPEEKGRIPENGPCRSVPPDTQRDSSADFRHWQRVVAGREPVPAKSPYCGSRVVSQRLGEFLPWVAHGECGGAFSSPVAEYWRQRCRHVCRPRSYDGCRPCCRNAP